MLALIQSRVEESALDGRLHDALDVVDRQVVEIRRDVVQALPVEPQEVALVGVDIRKNGHEHGQCPVALALHDAPHHAVVHEVRVQWKIFQSFLFDACHNLSELSIKNEE